MVDNVYLNYRGVTRAENALVTTRINEKVKQEATEVLASIGLSLSDAVHLLLTRVTNEKVLPFDLW
jgi:DNA-damage-inducible protein J